MSQVLKHAVLLVDREMGISPRLLVDVGGIAGPARVSLNLSSSS
ncbi:hypothetical protein [Neorhizobium petrolearium]|uniref:Uncharacterized protein n=1 Tax=Neorhizobium petrolearium TaxID=515361 RepID=A0ABY8MA44_9HYPH|nr:hypothetical protein [Neorhizobium petrolearium]WGI71383.1 hypothetical protein QEO92_22820 [Neorhizobium petrolearium]